MQKYLLVMEIQLMRTIQFKRNQINCLMKIEVYILEFVWGKYLKESSSSSSIRLSVRTACALRRYNERLLVKFRSASKCAWTVVRPKSAELFSHWEMHTVVNDDSGPGWFISVRSQTNTIIFHILKFMRFFSSEDSLLKYFIINLKISLIFLTI